MGRFVNPNNSAFQRALNSEIYVDKSGLLEFTNSIINTEQSMVCHSRPRRFGKSIAVNMLAAYYSRGASSEDMFADLEISKSSDFYRHLNKYDVICIDVQWFWMNAGASEKVVAFINEQVMEDMRAEYPDIDFPEGTNIARAMSIVNGATGHRFVVIIDEWDVLIRDELKKTAVQEVYINFLRGMFKGTEPTKYLALAYLTGILPIKVEKTQSALNNFDEYTMLSAGPLSKYIGFTDAEVRELCEKYAVDYAAVRHWYDGYRMGGYEIYNPKAVVSVMLRKEFQSYWSQTSTYQAITPLLNMDFDGLRADVVEMLGGASVPVNTKSFHNDMVTFNGKDDVLTLLIHLGYLGYNQVSQTAFIPNEEIRSEFLTALEVSKWNELAEFQRASEELLEATLDMDAEAVAEGIERIHMNYVSVIQYNNENSLSSVLSLAYLSTMQYYFRPVREMPLGRGFADFVFLPKPQYAEDYPALLVELKWNQRAKTALAQIKEKKYAESLTDYTGEILLVGISYDKKTKQHECVIESFAKQ